MGRSSELRKKCILEKIEREGSLLVKEIAETLTVSETSIRRDLNELDAQGLLKQVYGGAIGIRNTPQINVSVSNRTTLESAGKKCIGEAAAAMVQDNDIIYIDPGTTSWEMIPFLKAKHNLTIITNSVRIMACLEYIRHHNIIQLGGTLRPDRLDTIGSLTHLGIEQLRGYRAFQGGDGIDPTFGLSAVDHESALTAKVILTNAREIIALADHTKFDKPALLYKIISLERINHLITDQPLSSVWHDRCRTLGINVVTATARLSTY